MVDRKDLAEVEPIVSQWIRQRGTCMDGASYAAALELAAYVAARRTTPDREAWQPIETAPKDGTPIIGCTFHPQLMHLYAPCTIFWAAYHPNSEGEKTWRTSAICGNKMKGVTHWMPLPTAPTSDKGGA